MKNTKKIERHLKSDIKTFQREAQEDKELIKDMKKSSPKKKKKDKIERVMHEWKEGELHSGSKKGPKVTSEKQAIAIALSEARKAGQKVKPYKKKAHKKK